MNAFIKDESGAALVEYGLLVGLIAAVAIAAIKSLGLSINAVFSNVANKLQNVGS